MNLRKKMKTPKHDYENLGKDLGKLITEKQMAYGDSYGKSGEVLKQLFPNGIPKESYTDALAIVRIVDKLFRIATDPTWGDESPWKDIAGYALLRYADTEGSTNRKNNCQSKVQPIAKFEYKLNESFLPSHEYIERSFYFPLKQDVCDEKVNKPKIKKTCKEGNCKKDYNDKIEDKK